MKIHDIPGDPGKLQKTKRLGRGEGSGLGKTAGKGHKGQQARAGAAKGGTFEGGQMPLGRRTPKRGFTNPNEKIYTVINLKKLSEKYNNGDTVDPETMFAKNIISKKRCEIKILGDGDIDKKLTVKAHKFSKTAINKITEKGGTCEEIKC